MAIFDRFRRKLSPDDFAALVIQRAHAVAQPAAARYDSTAFQINFELADGRHSVMNLHNAFRDALAVPRTERGDVIDKYLVSLTDRPNDESLEIALASLMPVIRDTVTFAWAALHTRLSAPVDGVWAPCLRPFTDELSVAIVQDSEHATNTVNQKSLSSWGLDLDAAMNYALGNLRSRTDDAGMERHGGVWISTWNDVFDASRVLLTDMIHRLPVHGEPVAVIPSRNHLFVTGSLDDEGIARIAALAADVLEGETRPLSGELLLLRDGTWRPFHGNLTPGTARHLNLAKYKRLVGAYGEQKTLLEKIHEKEQVDVFVASYNAIEQTDTGRIFGSAQWTRGVITLLPRCDQLVLFCNRRNEALDIEWDEVVTRIPGLATSVGGLEPPRFFLSDFPDDGTYDVLKSHAVRVRAIQPG